MSELKRIYVLTSCLRKITGKGGSIIKEIYNETGCSVWVRKNKIDGDKTCVVLRGSPSSNVLAQTKITEITEPRQENKENVMEPIYKKSYVKKRKIKKERRNASKKSTKITKEDIDTSKKILLDKSIKAGDRFRKPKKIGINKKNVPTPDWKETTVDGLICLNLKQLMEANISLAFHTYKFTLKNDSNIFITMSMLKNSETKKCPDFGFVIMDENEKIVSMSLPLGANQAFHHQDKLLAGSYLVCPFTNGTKLGERSPASKKLYVSYPVFNGISGYLTFPEQTKRQFPIIQQEGKLIRRRFPIIEQENPYADFPLNIFPIFRRKLTHKFPFFLTFLVDSSSVIVRNERMSRGFEWIEAAMCDYIMTNGNQVNSKRPWLDCSVRSLSIGDRYMVAVENTNDIKQPPLRFKVNLLNSLNIAVYEYRKKKEISIASGEKGLAIHCVPLNPRIPVHIDGTIERL